MASGHMNRVKRPDTWLHRPMLQNVKKVLANPEPSTQDPYRKSATGNGAPDRVQFRPSHRCLISDVHSADRMPRGSIPRFEATWSISPRVVPISISSLSLRSHK